MKTQKELIEYYARHLAKVISHHGLASDATTEAFFLLQAVKMNMKLEDIFFWANKKCDELHEEALAICSPFAD